MNKIVKINLRQRINEINKIILRNRYGESDFLQYEENSSKDNASLQLIALSCSNNTQ